MAKKSQKQIKKTSPVKNKSKLIVIFIATIVFTIVGASLTSWLSSKYFEAFTQGVWYSNTFKITGALSLTSTLLSWVSFLVMLGTCYVFYNITKGNNVANNVKLLRQLLEFVVALAVLAVATQICSSICLTQYGEMKGYIPDTGTQVSDTSIAAPIMLGCAMIASSILLSSYKKATQA